MSHLAKKLRDIYDPIPLKEVQIRLTPKGFSMLHKRKSFRPEYKADKFHGTITFNASLSNTLRYFLKFGKEAEIISPKEYVDEWNKTLPPQTDDAIKSP